MTNQHLPDYKQQLRKLMGVLVQHVEECHPDPDMTEPCGVVEEVTEQAVDLFLESVGEDVTNAKKGLGAGSDKLIAAGQNLLRAEIRQKWSDTNES